jgi:hypothetical protein
MVGLGAENSDRPITGPKGSDVSCATAVRRGIEVQRRTCSIFQTSPLQLILSEWKSCEGAQCLLQDAATPPQAGILADVLNARVLSGSPGDAPILGLEDGSLTRNNLPSVVAGFLGKVPLVTQQKLPVSEH